MNFGFKLEDLGKILIISFNKDIPNSKRFSSELVNDNVILDIENGKKMIGTKGDSIVYEVYHLGKTLDKFNSVYKKTNLLCDLTLLNFGVFSTSDDGELFMTYGHLHETAVGEAYTVLKNECFFVLTDKNSYKTYIVHLREGDSILVHPRFIHRMVSFKKDCLVVNFVPEKAGHNYGIVKNKGFPFHLFYKNAKLEIVKNERYKTGEFELIKKVFSKIDPEKIFEKEPEKLKDILENPEKYKNLYFIGDQIYSMKPEQIFGVNAGKVWQTLKSKGPMSVEKISKLTKLKSNDIFGALGWLGRENKIQVIDNGKETLYKLNE